jgi:hypothetical protein
MNKKEKYMEFVYEEFYIRITEQYFKWNSHMGLNTPFEFLSHFVDGYIIKHCEGMYNIFTWNHYFTRNYYGFLSDEEQMEITETLFSKLYKEVSSYLIKNPSIGGDYDFPFAVWLNENYKYLSLECYEQ